MLTDFNPRSPHGERHFLGCSTSSSRWISIHALLTESDRFSFCVLLSLRRNFNPRSPHGERLWLVLHILHSGKFQSTLSSRRATALQILPLHALVISIHALLTESDLRGSRATRETPVFQSTLSSRRATGDGELHPRRCAISIHALLTESDDRKGEPKSTCCNFNPRSPHGERPLFLADTQVSGQISIHALLTESDP